MIPDAGSKLVKNSNIDYDMLEIRETSSPKYSKFRNSLLDRVSKKNILLRTFQQLILKLPIFFNKFSFILIWFLKVFQRFLLRTKLAKN